MFAATSAAPSRDATIAESFPIGPEPHSPQESNYPDQPSGRTVASGLAQRTAPAWGYVTNGTTIRLFDR